MSTWTGGIRKVAYVQIGVLASSGPVIALCGLSLCRLLSHVPPCVENEGLMAIPG